MRAIWLCPCMQCYVIVVFQEQCMCVCMCVEAMNILAAWLPQTPHPTSLSLSLSLSSNDL